MKLAGSRLCHRWFSHHLETEASSFPAKLGKDQKKRIWELLARSEELDRFLGKKFPNLKRYGESLHACFGPKPGADALDRV